VPAPSRPRDRRSTVMLATGFLVLAVLTVRQVVPGRGDVHEIAGHALGTTYSVKLAEPLSSSRGAAVATAIEGRLDEVDELMSTYRPDSELSRFNRHRSTRPYPLSAPTLEVFAVAQDVFERSGGAFDVTVGSLVDAWGFGPGDRSSRPSTPEVAALRSRAGSEPLALDREAGTIRKLAPDVVADLSAVAKGYAVDLVAETLVALGVSSFLVEIGGELRARGWKADGSRWRVGIERPEPAERTVHLALDLADEAIATSGDYRNFREQDGVRLAHIIDPRSGRPVPYAGASVSVVHARAAVADAWATALSVLGPEAGSAVAEREGLAALFILPGSGGYVTRATSAFRAKLGAGTLIER